MRLNYILLHVHLQGTMWCKQQQWGVCSFSALPRIAQYECVRLEYECTIKEAKSCSLNPLTQQYRNQNANTDVLQFSVSSIPNQVVSERFLHLKSQVMFRAIAAGGQCPALKLDICCVTCDSPISQRKKTSTLWHSRLNFSRVDAKPALNAILSMPKDVWLCFKILNQLTDCLGYLFWHRQSWKHHWRDKINKVLHVFQGSKLSFFFSLHTSVPLTERAR